jgi:hypothetical protein
VQEVKRLEKLADEMRGKRILLWVDICVKLDAEEMAEELELLLKTLRKAKVKLMLTGEDEYAAAVLAIEDQVCDTDEPYCICCHKAKECCCPIAGSGIEADTLHETIKLCARWTDGPGITEETIQQRLMDPSVLECLRRELECSVAELEDRALGHETISYKSGSDDSRGSLAAVYIDDDGLINVRLLISSIGFLQMFRDEILTGRFKDDQTGLTARLRKAADEKVGGEEGKQEEEEDTEEEEKEEFEQQEHKEQDEAAKLRSGGSVCASCRA